MRPETAAKPCSKCGLNPRPRYPCGSHAWCIECKKKHDKARKTINHTDSTLHAMAFRPKSVDRY